MLKVYKMMTGVMVYLVDTMTSMMKKVEKIPQLLTILKLEIPRT